MEVNSMLENINNINDDQHEIRDNSAEELIDLITVVVASFEETGHITP